MDHTESTESTEKRFGELTERVIGAAIEVHRVLGPGLLESAYEQCLAHELSLAGLRFRRQPQIAVAYKGLTIDAGFRADLIVDESLIVEIKSVENLLPLHTAQLVTYLRLSRIPVGLLINFNCRALKDGLRRVVS